MTDLEGLPQALRDRAADLIAGNLKIVPLADAATVALLRDGPGGLEVYMQRRSSTLAFAAGMYVFPGGRVEEQDADPSVAFTGDLPDPIPFATGGDIVLRLPGPPDPAATYRSLVAAAVRETLEECGVLLGARQGGAPVDAAGARAVQKALLAGQRLAAALAVASVAIDFTRLVGYAHWMTPAVEVRRFDTRFFIAELPATQEPDSISGESDASGWVRPGEMLQRLADGEVFLLPPTVAALTALQQEVDAASAVATGHRAALRPVLPHPFAEGDSIRWRLIDGYTGQPWAAAR